MPGGGRDGSSDARHQTGPALIHGRDAISRRQIRCGALVKGVDVGGCELSRRDPLREQNVELFEGAVLGLRKPEEGPDEREKGGCAPHESGVPAQVPGFRVHEIWLQHARDHADDVVGVAREADGLLPQAGRADFGGQGPAELAGAELEEECPWCSMSVCEDQGYYERWFGGDLQTSVRTA